MEPFKKRFGGSIAVATVCVNAKVVRVHGIFTWTGMFHRIRRIMRRFSGTRLRRRSGWGAGLKTTRPVGSLNAERENLCLV